jgi:hypothetical protein
MVVLAIGALALWSRPSGPISIETRHLATLPPHEHEEEDAVSNPRHHTVLESDIYVAPRDLYVTKVGFEIVNAPNVTLHHASLVDVSRPNQTCTNMTNWRELFVYGSDRMYDNDLTFPEGYALKIPKGSPLKLVFMVHNPEPPLGPGGTYSDVYSQITLTESTQSPATLKLLEPRLLHLDDPDITCWHKETDLSDFYTFTVPAHVKDFVFSGKGAHDPAATMTFSRGATLFDLSGHLHGWQLGKKLIVRKNGVVMHQFDTRPSSSTPYIYETRHVEEPFHVAAGDTLSVSAIYDNPHSVPTRGAMGIAGFYYHEDE